MNHREVYEIARMQKDPGSITDSDRQWLMKVKIRIEARIGSASSWLQIHLGEYVALINRLLA